MFPDPLCPATCWCLMLMRGWLRWADHGCLCLRLLLLVLLLLNLRLQIRQQSCDMSPQPAVWHFGGSYEVVLPLLMLPTDTPETPARRQTHAIATGADAFLPLF